LMIILAVMIGFAMGNVYGQQKMKMIFNDLLNKLTNGMKVIAGTDEKGEKKN
jgi:hypothetical protein